METLQAFHARVDGFQRDSLPHEGPLVTKPLLVEKVAPDGKLRPFFGNTMIFDLPPDVQLAITRLQLILHHRCEQLLAQPLAPHTLHMTLHDLLNGIDKSALQEPVRRTEEQAKAILARQRAANLLPSVHLREIFNLAGIVNPAILLHGRVVGKWKEKNGQVELTSFEPLTDIDREHIVEEVIRLFLPKKIKWT